MAVGDLVGFKSVIGDLNVTFLDLVRIPVLCTFTKEVARFDLTLNYEWRMFQTINRELTSIVQVIVSDIPGRQSMAEQPRPGSHYFHKSKKMLCIRCLDGWVSLKFRLA